MKSVYLRKRCLLFLGVSKSWGLSKSSFLGWDWFKSTSLQVLFINWSLNMIVRSVQGGFLAAIWAPVIWLNFQISTWYEEQICFLPFLWQGHSNVEHFICKCSSHPWRSGGLCSLCHKNTWKWQNRADISRIPSIQASMGV